MKNIDITNKKFGKLTAIKLDKSDKNGQIWLCKCDCGNIITAYKNNLRNGNTSSCGCLKIEKSTKHGKYGTLTYSSWQHMKDRCDNPNTKEYKWYGARGITYCDRWNTFENFYEDMGERVSKNVSIDRINNDGNYEPSNCRWATQVVQTNNSRKNHIVNYNGESLTLSEISQKYNVDYNLVNQRIFNGWNIDKTISEPSRTKFATYNGKNRKVTELAKEFNLSSELVGRRLRNGWSIERALNTPVDISKNRYKNLNTTNK